MVARFELEMLAELGFGLDLSACAATGATIDLVYVSPRSGRAVSRIAGAPYADRLLPLPFFLREGRPCADARRGRRRLPADGILPSSATCSARGELKCRRAAKR